MPAVKFALLWLLLAGPVAAQPIQHAGETGALYNDAASGMTFPPQVGTFRRINLTRDGAGLHAFYQDGEAGMSVSVFLTSMTENEPPLAQPCAAYEDLSRRSAQLAHPGLLNPRQVPPLAGLAGMTGTGFSQSWSEPGGTAWLSDKLHYCRNDGRWAVEYQFFYPAELDEAGALQAAFLTGYAWSVKE